MNFLSTFQTLKMIDPGAASSAIVVSCLLVLSEVLPFFAGIDANGILQGIVHGVASFVTYRRYKRFNALQEPGTPNHHGTVGQATAQAVPGRELTDIM
jgi:hypothetical protein